MGKEAKSGKAGRNKGDKVLKERVTQRHRDVRVARRAREHGKALLGRAERMSLLSNIATRLGARISTTGTPSRAKRDLIAFISDPITDTRAQRGLRLRYGRMTIKEFTTHIAAKIGG